MVVAHCFRRSSNLRSRHLILLMAVLAVGRRRMDVVGIADSILDAGAVVMPGVGR
jgi:hypothetical protein